MLISALDNRDLNDINNEFLYEQINLLCNNSCIKIIKQIKNAKDIDYKKIQEILIKSNKYQQIQTSFYYKELGICYFYNGRKIQKIKELINEYKNNIKDEKWRYYDTIISAYENESEQKILEELFLAFKEKYDLNKLISLIKNIPELETKNMFNFLLFILYFEYKKYKIGKIYLEKYISRKNNNKLEDETIEKLSERYNYGKFEYSK